MKEGSVPSQVLPPTNPNNTAGIKSGPALIGKTLKNKNGPKVTQGSQRGLQDTQIIMAGDWREVKGKTANTAGMNPVGKLRKVTVNPMDKTSTNFVSADESVVNETLGKNATAKDYIKDFIKSKNSRFAGDSKEKRRERAIAAYMHRNESVDEKTLFLHDFNTWKTRMIHSGATIQHRNPPADYEKQKGHSIAFSPAGHVLGTFNHYRHVGVMNAEGVTEGTRTEKAVERAASRARIEKHHADTRAAVAAGKCPNCGAGVHSNNSLAGWWQCDRSGSGHFRKDKTGSECHWQGFTEEYLPESLIDESRTHVMTGTGIDEWKNKVKEWHGADIEFHERKQEPNEYRRHEHDTYAYAPGKKYVGAFNHTTNSGHVRESLIDESRTHVMTGTGIDEWKNKVKEWHGADIEFHERKQEPNEYRRHEHDTYAYAPGKKYVGAFNHTTNSGHVRESLIDESRTHVMTGTGIDEWKNKVKEWHGADIEFHERKQEPNEYRRHEHDTYAYAPGKKYVGAFNHTTNSGHVRESLIDDGVPKHGDFVHAGFGTRGGAGIHGTVLKIDGNMVHIKGSHMEYGLSGPYHKTYKAHKKVVTVLNREDYVVSMDDVQLMLDEAANNTKTYNKIQKDINRSQRSHRGALWADVPKDQSPTNIAQVKENYADWHEHMSKKGGEDIQFKIKNAGGRTEAWKGGKKLGHYDHEKRQAHISEEYIEEKPRMHMRSDDEIFKEYGQIAHKGYLIHHHPNEKQSKARISKDGYHISWAKDLNDAKHIINTHLTEDVIFEAGNPSKDKMKRKYLGKTKGRTATGKKAHEVVLDPIIKIDDKTNNIKARLPTADRGL